MVIELSKLDMIISVTNAWPERSVSAVKRIKIRSRSAVKNDLLNALLHISMNGPPANRPEAEPLINRVVDQYIEQRPTNICYDEDWKYSMHTN